MTQALTKYLERQVAELKEEWASGAFTDQSQFGTAIKNAKAIGCCEMCDRVIGFSYDDVLGEKEDGQGNTRE